MPGLRMRATAWRASQDPQADTAVVTLLEADVLEPLQAVHWERSRKTGRGWEGDSGRELWAHCLKPITTLCLSGHLSGSGPGTKSCNGVQYGSWVLWVTLCLSSGVEGRIFLVG